MALYKLIVWSRISFKKNHRRAKVVIVSEQRNSLTSGEKDLLKIELRDTFPQARDSDITFVVTSWRCFMNEGKWALVWKVPKEGLPIQKYKGWLEFNIPRQDESLMERLVIPTVLSPLQFFRTFKL